MTALFLEYPIKQIVTGNSKMRMSLERVYVVFDVGFSGNAAGNITV